MIFREKLASLPLIFLVAVLNISPLALAQAEDLSVLGGWIRWSDAGNMLQHHLNLIGYQLLEKRSLAIRGIQTPEAWRARQAEIRGILQKIAGPFPERTPLNLKTLATVKKDGFTIEKVVFESVPKFYVTGCLFIPTRRAGQGPAILNVIGHTDIAFRAPSYQHLILNLVRKGFIVLAMDPVGQGERLQYFDPEQQRSLVGGSTSEHSYFGKQCFLTGSSAAHYFAWDGIRAIDYLISRPEVDPNRIGVTGISGGGTQTSYIAALDERVAAAAPACYIASFRRLLESIGPQDAEQNFNAGLVHGIDHGDLLAVRAPRPTLIVSTTRDFFSIQGARETYAEAKQAFRVLGAEGNLSMAEDDFGHGYTKKTREAIYSFFQQHLNNPGNPADEEVDILPISDLMVTRTGQVSDSLGGETVFSLNRSHAYRLSAHLEASRANLPAHLEKVRSEALRLSGYQAPGPLTEVVYRGRHSRAGYHVEMYLLPGEGECVVPALYFLPEARSPHRALIYLHPQGKSAAAAPGGEIEQLLKQGYAVLAPDIAGVGEAGRTSDAIAFLGVLTGRSIAGIRAGDIARCLRFLKSRPEVDGSSIGAVARGNLGVPLLHAAAFEESISKIALIEPLVSFQSVAASRYYSLEAGVFVTGALTAYDLPDLTAALAPRKLAMINVVDPLQKPAAMELSEKSLEVVRRSYSARSAAGNLTIATAVPTQPLVEVLASWLEGR